VLVVIAGAALAAAAPRPVRPVSSDLYSGRWYEIARTPNTMQKDCQAPTTDFQGATDGAFSVVETCHKGSPLGPAKVVKVRAKILRPPDNTRFRMSFLGGMVHQEYWIVDHADDNAWAVMGTPGGNYVWLLSRRPTLPPAVLATALGRMESLGYARARLIYPAQAGG
jgi:apolipoprotein D and lipocalin family protein